MKKGDSQISNKAWRFGGSLAFLFFCLTILFGCGGSNTNETANNAERYIYNDQVYPYSPGWYHGVLHSHALYDAGETATPIARVVDIAEQEGFDFFVITNHNTVFQWSDPGYYSTELTMLYGLEWSSSKGHANIWSDEPFDWDAIAPTLATADAKQAIKIAHGLSTPEHPVLFSINHPDRIKNGLHSWKASLGDSAGADAIEVWNGDDIFMASTDTFPAYIAQGSKMTMEGGSDDHLKSDDAIPAFTERLGRPTTWVYADSRSGKDILMGIKQGHVFISATSTGPRLNFTAGADPDIRIMGDTLPTEDLGTQVNFSVSVSDADVPYGVVIIKDGLAQELWSQTFADPVNAFSFTDTPEPGDYYRIEVRQLAILPASFDELISAPISALSNPIYTW